VLVATTWEGSRILFRIFDGRFSEKLSLHLISLFLVSILCVLLLASLTAFVVARLFDQPGVFYGFNQILGFCFRINLFLHSINAIVSYNTAFNQAKLESESLKKETSEAQLEALRSQINPHFLFNSFNALTSVIETNTELAVRYVDQLSQVYRYLLNTLGESLVSITREKEFITAYLFLLKTRFQENLSYNLDIPDSEYLIPPSTLQILIENAIKHNEVSSDHPLEIILRKEGDWIIVSNNKKPLRKAEASSGLGLQNIRQRYELLNQPLPIIKENDDQFTVKIAIVKFDP
jgi:LytS/YehU family sensor histidine kinase